MSEVWVLEQLKSVRDIARSNAMYRLAEHLDDAMLLAASEFHDMRDAVGTAAYNDRAFGKPDFRIGGRDLH